MSGAGYFRWWLRLIKTEETIADLQAENDDLIQKVGILETDLTTMFQTVNELTLRIIHMENVHSRSIPQSSPTFLPSNFLPSHFPPGLTANGNVQ